MYKRRFTSILPVLFLLSLCTPISAQPAQGDAAALIAAAKSFWRKNDQEKALVTIQKAISADPRNPAAYVQLALIHAAMDDDNKARMAVEEALKIDPNYAPAHQQRGSQLRRAKDFEGAIREAKLALSLKPDPEFEGYAHLTLGRTYEELKRYDEALNEYREAIRSNSADGTLHRTLGSALFSLRRYDEAEGAFRRAVEIDPLDSNAVVNLAASLHNQAKRDESIKYYREYLRLEPKASNRATLEQRISQLENTPEPHLRGLMLIVMAQEGDAANVAALIKSGADPNHRSTFDAQTPLSAAARKGSLEVIKLLLSHGAKDVYGTAITNAYEAGNADIEKVLQQAGPATPEAQSRLLAAFITKGDAARAQSLIASGIDADALDQALFLAVKQDAELIEIVRLLVDKGARVNQLQMFRTPLMLAVDRDHVETIKLLLAKGADVNKIVNGTTALSLAVQDNNAAVVRLLVAAGADTKAQNLLALAAGAPWVTDEDENPYPERTSEILQLLLDKGANAKSPDGDKALLVANSPEKTKLLLAQGANPNVTGDQGSTPLMVAAERGNSAIVDALLSDGANVNAQDSNGDTALLLFLDASDSRRKRNVEDYPVLVRRLVSIKDSNVNAQNNKGETALMRAVRLGNVESVRLLLGAGANPHAADKVGDTSYVLAYANGNAEIQELLLTKGEVQKKTPAVLNAFLVAAIAKKDTGKVKELLDQGADPNYHHPIGLNHLDIINTVLMEAAKVGDAAIVQMLVDKGADPNAKGLISGSEHGLVYGTPLEAAKNPQVIEILKKAANKKI